MFTKIIVLILCAFVLIRYFQHTSAQNSTPRFEEGECEFAPPTGYTPECGYLIVPEDRSDPDSPTISLAVAIYRSQSANPQPDPIVYLIGGPGGSAIEYQFVSFNPRYRSFVEDRDYIIFDQRGALHSDPSLDCTNLFRPVYQWMSDALTNAELAANQADAIVECHDDLVADGVNVAAYNSAENAADVADLRRALGYEEWNLFGVSYGVRLALTVMRDDPEGIRSVVLDSVYPPQVDLFMEYGSNTAAAFANLFTACAEDEACNEAYPDLEAHFYDLVAELDAQPRPIAFVHTISNNEITAYVTGEMLFDEIFGLMYRRDDIPRIPYLIYDALNGGEELLASAAQNFLDSPYGISEGLYYAIQCSEEAPFTDWDTAYANLTLLPEVMREHTYLATVERICSEWTITPPAAVENQIVTSDIPTLVLNGEFDPITPPMWAAQTADALSNAYLYVFPGTGHGVVRSTDCGVSIMQDFLDKPNREPDASCLDELGVPEWILP
jgi:pimeloyl-ACP methyl ester carboxylesterase